jgi:hypothetical protein
LRPETGGAHRRRRPTISVSEGLLMH